MLVTGAPAPSAPETSAATLRELATMADARDRWYRSRRRVSGRRLTYSWMCQTTGTPAGAARVPNTCILKPLVWMTSGERSARGLVSARGYGAIAPAAPTNAAPRRAMVDDVPRSDDSPNFASASG